MLALRCMSGRRFSAGHMARIVWTLGWADFALKYRGSFLGYFWSLAGPLMRFLVIYHVFRPFVAESIPYYHLYLLLGLIVWEHFSLTTNACMSMLIEKSGVIQRVTIPRILLILAVGWEHLIIFFTHLLVFLAIAWFFDVSWSLSNLYTLLIFFQMTLLGLGIGMVLSASSLRFRDLKHIWEVMTQVLFWLTPIMYEYRLEEPLSSSFVKQLASAFPSSFFSWFDLFIRYQPLSIVMYDARRALLYPDLIGIPSFLHAAILTLVCLAFFLAGAFVFQRRSGYFLQEY